MSRDYKPKSNSRPAAGRGGPMFAGILIGLILGLGIALGIAWYINKTPSPFVAHEAEKQPSPPPVSLTTTQPEEKKAEKPRFDFYKILPGQEAPAASVPQPAPSAEPASESFYLQAGAFQKKDEADNMKAKLAMLGLESEIQASPGSDPKYRVRLGPYQGEDELRKTQESLQQNGITASIVKIKETSQ